MVETDLCRRRFSAVLLLSGTLSLIFSPGCENRREEVHYWSAIQGQVTHYKADSAWNPDPKRLESALTHEVTATVAERLKQMKDSGLAPNELRVRLETLRVDVRHTEVAVDLSLRSESKFFSEAETGPGARNLRTAAAGTIIEHLQATEQLWQAEHGVPLPQISSLFFYTDGEEAGRIVLLLGNDADDTGSTVSQPVITGVWSGGPPNGAVESVVLHIRADDLHVAGRASYRIGDWDKVKPETEWQCVIRVGGRVFRTPPIHATLIGGSTSLWTPYDHPRL